MVSDALLHFVSHQNLFTLSPEMRRALVMGGSDLLTMEKALDEGLWNRPMLDPETSAVAVDILNGV